MDPEEEDICNLFSEIKDKWELIVRIEAALKRGADINQLCENAEVPIHTCAQLGDDYIEVTTFLIERGADVNLKYEDDGYNEGGRPVFFRLLNDIITGSTLGRGGHFEKTIEYLLERIDLDLLSDNDENVFSFLYESFFGRRNVAFTNYLLEALLQKGANPYQVVNFIPYDAPPESEEESEGIHKSFVGYLKQESGYARPRAREILKIIENSTGGSATKSAKK